jgi:hypothetical protein
MFNSVLRVVTLGLHVLSEVLGIVGIVRCIEKLLIACASMNMDSCCKAR